MAGVRRSSAVLALALVLGSCGLGDRQQQADTIIDSSKAAFAAGTALGTLTTSMQFVRLPEGAGSFLGNAGGPPARSDGAAADGAVAGSSDTPDPRQQLAQAQQQQMERAFTVVVALDLKRDQAAVALASKPDKAFAIYDGLRSYGRRWSAGPRDARPWVRVDGADINESDEIDPTEDAPAFFAFALNPVLLVDLIAGPLAGSVRRVGTETLEGVETTHYKANFDIDKVMRKTRRSRFPEDTRKAYADVLEVLAVSGKIHKGEVWVDAQGRPRQFTIRLKEEPIKHFVIEHTITLRLATFGEKAELVIPTPRERIDVRSVVQYLRATIPSPRTPEFLTFLGLPPQAAPTASTTTTTAAPLAPPVEGKA